MKAKSLKRSGLLLGVVAVMSAATGSLYFYHHSVREHERAGWKAQGLAAARAGDHTRAVEQLARYLRVHFDDAEALRAYAGSRLATAPAGDRQAARDAVAVLQGLSSLGQMTDDERTRLLQLYVQLQHDPRVVRTAASVLQKHPDDPTALRAETGALMREHDWAEAVKAARHWCAVADLDPEAHATALLAMREAGATPREIVGRAVELRKAHPAGDARFELLESIALTMTSQPAESVLDGQSADPRTAAQWAQAAAEHATADPQLTAPLVNQLDRLGLFDDSLRVLEKSVGPGTQDAPGRILARRLWEAGRWNDLAHLLERWSGGPPSDPELLCWYGSATAQLGRPRDAAVARNALAAREADPRVKGWLRVLDRCTVEPTPDVRAVIDDYQPALATESQNAYFHWYLAEALERLGETDLAVAHLRASTSLTPTWGSPPARLAELLLQQGRVDASLLAVTEAKRRMTHDGRMTDLPTSVLIARIGYAALTTGRSTDAAGLIRLAEAVQASLPGEPQTLAIQTALLVRAGNTGGAKRVLAAALHQPAPPGGPALLQYAAISRENDLGLEDECFDRYERENGKTIDLAFARATNLFAGGAAPEKAMALFDATASGPATRQGSSGGDDLARQWARVRLMEAVGEKGAPATWAGLGDAHPENSALQQAVLGSRSAAQDRTLIDRTIDRLRKLTGDDGLQWQLARARRLLDDPAAPKQDVEAVSRSLAAILLTTPECIDAHRLQAEARSRLGDPVEAIARLDAAAALAPDSLEIAQKLASVLEAHQDYYRASEVVRPFTEGPRASAAALAAYAWAVEHDGRPDAAEKAYRRALELNPRLGGAKNNLAMLLVNHGGEQPIREAIALAREACASQPTVADFYDTLAAAHGKAKDYSSALASITKAITLKPSEPGFRVRQIELLADAGQSAAARAALAELEERFPDLSSNPHLDREVVNRIRALKDTLNPPVRPAAAPGAQPNRAAKAD